MNEAGPPPLSVGVEAGGERSIAVGRDAVASIFATGDHNQFFVGQYERLADAYLPPWPLYRELVLEHFTGRRWLVESIDAFLAARDRGYFVLEAEVGLGKTTFLAWLAKERGYIHHFVRLMPNTRDLGAALRNLCAQLIRAWNLTSRAVGGVLPAAASRPDFFHELLYEAAERRDAQLPGQPIVIVVDGLDEVEPLPNQNVLSLPASLPRGVYFVVSQRNVYVPLVVKVPRQVVSLTATAPENVNDMRTYLRDAAGRPEIARALASEATSPDQFVDQLMDKCRGVWIYLYYVVSDLESGQSSIGELDTLPTGLWQYYAQFWQYQQQAHGAAWDSLHQPLLTTIAAAQENLTAPLLGSLAGIEDSDRVGEVLEGSWRPFLEVDDTGDEPRFGIFHASLREFLEGRVDLSSLTTAERTIVRRIAEATVTAHGRIADRYLQAWGGFANSLEGLLDTQLAGMDGAYGLRHLAVHLIAGEREEELHRLLWTGWGSEEVPAAPGGRVVNAWREVHERAGYLPVYVSDVARAWALAERQSQRLLTAGQDAATLSLELRYALLATSVRSLAANIPPALLLGLIQRRKLSPGQALAYARQAPEPVDRAEALLTLSATIPEPLRSDVLHEALAAARSIDDEQLRAGSLARLAPFLPAEWQADAVAVAGTIIDNYWRSAALGAIELLIGKGPAAVPARPDRDPGDESWYRLDLAVPHALAIAHVIGTRQAEALARLTARLPTEPRDDELQAALAAVRAVAQDRWRAEALTALASQLPEQLRDDVLEEGLAAARAVGDGEEHGRALAALAMHLGAAGRHQQAMATAGVIPDPYRRARALAGLAELLPDPLRAEAGAATLAALAAIASDEGRAQLLARNPAIGVLDGGARAPSPAVLQTLGDVYWRAVVLVTLIPLLDGDPADRALQEAFATATRLEDPHRRGDLLARLAALLPAALVGRALEMTAAIEEPDDRARSMAALVPRLLQVDSAAAAAETTAAIPDPYWRAETQARLVDRLLQAGQVDEGLRTARSIPFPHWRAEALAGVARRLPAGARDAVVEEALQTARGAGDEARTAQALVRVAPLLAEPTGRQTFREALDVTRRLDEPHARSRALAVIAAALAKAGLPEEALTVTLSIDDHYWRADALIHLAPELPAERLHQALDHAAAISNEHERARALAALLPRFAGFPAAELHAVWQETLHLLGAGPRRELLLALPGLLPALARLGGPDALVDSARIIQSVRRWWP